MMKAILFLITVSFYGYCRTQERLSYHSKFGEIVFTVIPNEYYVEYEDKDSLVADSLMINNSFRISKNAEVIEQSDLNGSDFSSRKSQLDQNLNHTLQRIEPVLLFADSTKQIAKGEINIQVKNGYSIEDVINSYNYDFEIRPLVEKDHLYTITSKTLGTAQLFTLVDSLGMDSRVEFAEPNFIRIVKLDTNDPYFDSQWNINNNGDSGWTPGADMKVESAWNYSTGKSVKVAIIDEGVQLNHPDLQANLLPGYDATGGNSEGGPAYLIPPTVPSNPSNGDFHGTACAGIVAAVANNNIGIAGVAYDAKIIPVRIGYSNPAEELVTNDSWIADGINWAWQHGADILSDSWGGGSYSSTIVNAIDNAVNNGRNGKGSVVLFSTGNDDSDVSFPATLENVIAVGASNPCDLPQFIGNCGSDNDFNWGENFGEGLDVIAPGVKVYTTDLTGSAGATPSDYYPNFRGTSASCPNAAAVCALILAVDTNMTGIQVRNTLETTCDKIGYYSTYANVPEQPNGTWNEQTGYGRVNACRAVLMAYNGGEPILNTTITANTLLSGDIYSTGDLVVESGATLTITGTIRFSDSMKVIVKPGAKLIVDGGVLTNIGGCGSFWKGIEVWGTSNKNQFPESNPTYQGLLLLKNGGTIENAHVAVTNWKTDDFNSIGGVIQSTDGIFRNNRRDVAFMSYQNHTPTTNTPTADFSKFVNTDFVTDDFHRKFY